MITSENLYLSYILDEKTPTYGDRNSFKKTKTSNISKGDIANDTTIETTVHIGTHIDMPYHFFNNGQTINDFDINYFSFKNILFIEINPNNLILKDEIISNLESIENKDTYDILILKTGICHKRQHDSFWKTNYGFHPLVAHYIRENFTNIRVFGFDSISISSFTERLIGREAHKAFLNPEKPILLLEDMDLTKVDSKVTFNKIIIAPLRISKCDGLPCTVLAEVKYS